MKFLNVALLSFFASSVTAAECNPGSISADRIPGELLHAYWDARNKMCGNTDCAFGADCTVNTFAANANTQMLFVTLKRTKHGVKGFKDCYDATNNLINQCIYGQHFLNGKWEFGGQTYILESRFNNFHLSPPPPPPNGCNVNKYCAYTYRNNNCAISTWNCDSCPVPIFWECNVSASCGGGAQCINNLCCHVDKLAGGASQCATRDDLQKCGNYQRQVGTGSTAAWVPPHTDIPSYLKCGC